MNAPEANQELPPPTAPEQYTISLRGFESEDAANLLGNILRSIFLAISSFIDLERLDGVTVAYNYAVALAELDRGIETSRPLEATGETFAVGIAMTPAVVRDGRLKAHIVLSANALKALEKISSDGIDPNILYLLAHECGHVHHLKAIDNAFPDTLLKRRYSDIRDKILTDIVVACLDEYTACRLSAKFSSAETVERYAQVFIGATKEARARADDHITNYQSDGDLQKVTYAVALEYSNVLKFAAYLLGHLHGLGQRLDDDQAVSDFIKGHWCEEYVDRLAVALADLATRYGAWKDIAEFNCISDVADDLLWNSGLGMSILPNGEIHVGIFDRSDD